MLQCEACNGKLNTLKDGGKTVSPEEKDRVSLFEELKDIIGYAVFSVHFVET